MNRRVSFRERREPVAGSDGDTSTPDGGGAAGIVGVRRRRTSRSAESQLTRGPRARGVDLTCRSTAAATADVQVDPDLSVARLHSRWSGLEMQSFEYLFQPRIRIRPSFSISAAGGCEVAVPLVQRDLTPITFFIGPIPVVVTQKWGVDLEASIDAVGSVEYSTDVVAEAALGVRLQNGQLRPFSSAGVSHIGDDRDVDVAMTASVGVPLFYEAGLYGAFKARPSIGPSLELEVEPRPDPGDPAITLDATLDAGFSLAAGVKIDLVFGSVGWEKRAAFGPLTLLRRTILERGRINASPHHDGIDHDDDHDDDQHGPGRAAQGRTGAPPAGEDAELLAAARQAWSAQPGGATYAISYRIDGTSHCVEGVVGDPGATVPFAQGQGCGASEVADPAGTRGVDGWHDFAAQAIAEGRLVTAFYEGATGRPTYIETSDGFAVTLEWLIRPGA